MAFNQIILKSVVEKICFILIEKESLPRRNKLYPSLWLPFENA